jgi:inner membrane protein COX18
MMTLIHTQLPWYATLPLSAFIMRGLLVTTFGAKARSLIARYIGLNPLRQAITRHKSVEIGKRRNHASSKALKLTIAREVRSVTGPLDARWKCSLRGQFGWTFAQIPIFITMAEVVRQMAATQDGLLGMALTAFGLKDAPSQAHGDVVMGPENPWFEPSLANEGMLWFPDLLAADPSGALPFVLSGIMFTNIYISKNGSPDGMASTTSTAIRRLLLGVALLIGPLTQQLPAALLLYWSSSTTSVLLWNLWLDRKYPAPRGFMACKRPLMNLPPPKVKTKRM